VRLVDELGFDYEEASRLIRGVGRSRTTALAAQPLSITHRRRPNESLALMGLRSD
jgi:hypothetical protein